MGGRMRDADCASVRERVSLGMAVVRSVGLGALREASWPDWGGYDRRRPGPV